jgi:hypothetical protein
MREKIIKLTLVALILLCAVAVCWYCDRWAMRYADSQRDTISVRIDSVRDTTYVYVHDTMPVVKNERVVEYIKVPVSDLSACLDGNVDNKHDSTCLKSDSINMQIVQRQYSDDSTYTAYVSGLRYNQWPKLDSIIVRQREITNTITKTITIQKKRSRFSVGLQAGYGYGFQYRGFEPYVGVGVNYALFPP